MKETTTKETTTDARRILRHWAGVTPEREAHIQRERERYEIAQQIYDLRTAAGLTQAELAERIGTQASAICRLESAAYRGHSLPILRKVAAALDAELQVHLVPREKAA
jgi:ribosome-binding protein aMBF1 (putative translation factor)